MVWHIFTWNYKNSGLRFIPPKMYFTHINEWFRHGFGGVWVEQKKLTEMDEKRQPISVEE